MPDLQIRVAGATTAPNTLAPLLNFELQIEERSGCRIDAITLHAQLQLEAARRPYSEREQEAVLDLFGVPARWGRTLRSMLWTLADTTVPGFDGTTAVELPVPCSYDLTVAATKYFFALDGGEVPLAFLFSGTVFYRDQIGDLQIEQLPWTLEARYGLPVATWSALMKEHYPDTTWIGLDRDAADRLHRYRARCGLPTWEDAVNSLLATAAEPARS